MSTTCCAEARSGIAVYERLQDIPAQDRVVFGTAVGHQVFDSYAWYETTVAAALPPDVSPRFLVYYADGTPVIALPMQVSRQGRELTSLTTPYSCRYQPLCDPSVSETVLAQGLAAFVRFCHAWPVVRLDALDEEAPWLPVLSEAGAAAGMAIRVFDHFGNWHEDVAGQDWGRYLAARPGALRETIRRRSARAERAGARFVLVTGGTDLEPGIAAYEAVYARSWKPHEPFPAFNAALMRAMAAQGLLRLGLCWYQDKIVAAQFWILDAGHAIVLKLAHDEAMKANSPGTVLTAWVLQQLLDHEHVTQIDFGRGDDAYKQQWAHDRRQRVGIVLANPRHPRGLAFLGRHALGRMRRAVQR